MTVHTRIAPAPGASGSFQPNFEDADGIRFMRGLFVALAVSLPTWASLLTYLSS